MLPKDIINLCHQFHFVSIAINIKEKDFASHRYNKQLYDFACDKVSEKKYFIPFQLFKICAYSMNEYWTGCSLSYLALIYNRWEKPEKEEITYHKMVNLIKMLLIREYHLQ